MATKTKVKNKNTPAKKEKRKRKIKEKRLPAQKFQRDKMATKPDEIIWLKESLSSSELAALNPSISRIDVFELDRLIREGNTSQILLVDLRDYLEGEPSIPNSVQIPLPPLIEVITAKKWKASVHGRDGEFMSETSNRKPDNEEEREKDENERDESESERRERESKMQRSQQIERMQALFALSPSQWKSRFGFDKPVAPQKAQTISPDQEQKSAERFLSSDRGNNANSQWSLIVFYSGTGRRSDVMTECAQRAGLSQSRSLLGGIRLWNKYFQKRDLQSRNGVDLERIQKNLFGTYSTSALFKKRVPKDELSSKEKKDASTPTPTKINTPKTSENSKTSLSSVLKQDRKGRKEQGTSKKEDDIRTITNSSNGGESNLINDNTNPLKETTKKNKENKGKQEKDEEPSNNGNKQKSKKK